jgi:hypothetical protein
MTPYHARGYFVSEHEILSGFKVIDDQKRKVSTILGKDHHAWWNYSLASHEIVGVRGVKPERYAYALGGQFRYAILDGAETLAVAASGKWKAFTPAARPLLFPSSQQDRRRVPEQPAR